MNLFIVATVFLLCGLLAEAQGECVILNLIPGATSKLPEKIKGEKLEINGLVSDDDYEPVDLVLMESWMGRKSRLEIHIEGGHSYLQGFQGQSKGSRAKFTYWRCKDIKLGFKRGSDKDYGVRTVLSGYKKPSGKAIKYTLTSGGKGSFTFTEGEHDGFDYISIKNNSAGFIHSICF